MQVSLGDWFVGLRNRLVMNPGFQRWASAFPLTRPIARARARSLFDLCAGFVYTQVLYACVKLKLFDHLAAGPRTASALAAALDLSEAATLRLLRAAAALDLVTPRGPDRFALGSLGAAFLGNPGVGAMVEHHALLYGDLQDPVTLLRADGAQDTALKRFWAYAGTSGPETVGAEQTAGYTALMAASQTMIAEEVLGAISLGRYRCLLDVGGGNGTFLRAVAARNPHLRLMLFDLPSVAEEAKRRFAKVGLQERAEVVGGSFFADSLPTGADLISFVRVLHDHNDDKVLHLLQAARRALPDDGALLVAEPMSGTAGAEPMGDAYFGLYLLAMGSGRPRTPAEYRALLEAAGFGAIKWISTRKPLLTRLLICRPVNVGAASTGRDDESAKVGRT